MAVETVVFDVGETLIDETGMWERAADAAGVPRFTLMGVLGGLAARGEPHNDVWGILGVDHPASTWEERDFYPDALPCLAELRARGLYLGIAGNQSHELEEWIRGQGLQVDLVASLARWGVEKPSPEFFARVVSGCGFAPDEVAYVGDRVDNDVEPARAAGLLAVHVRRGPWGYLQDASMADLRVDSLAELPDRLAAYV